MTGQPTAQEWERLVRMLEPWRRLASPVFVGLDRLPADGPRMLVGNHTLFGVLDVPFLVVELYQRKGIVVHGLGDHAHFKVPVWRDFVARFGAVDGTPENCARLMAAGETVLVFPGGAREVAKRRGEAYSLLWKERLGFARLAKKHAVPIVPFAAVGVEDAFDIVLDADDLLASPLGNVVRKLGIRQDFLPPLVKPIPRAERLYFHIGNAIDPAGFDDDESGIRALREATAAAIQSGIAELLRVREEDPYRRLLPRTLDAVRRRLA